MSRYPAAVPGLLFASVLAACSGDDDEDTAVEPANDAAIDGGAAAGSAQSGIGIATSALDGRWQGTCVPYEPLGLYQRNELEIGGGEFDVVNGTFADAACTLETVTVEVEGTALTTEAASIDGTASGTVDLVFETIGLTPLVAEAARQLHEMAACERTDYAVGVTSDLEGCALVGIESLPAPFYDRYLVGADTLYLGSERADTPEARPEGVDLGVGYTRLP